MEEITAIFVRERLRFESSDGDTIIADIRLVDGSGELFADSLPVAVKGKADIDELQSHQTYRFYGRGWQDYTNKRTSQTEHQFNFQTFIRSQPHGRAGVIAYLKQAGRGHGIGQARATTLWDKFGSDAVRILREEPEIAAAAVAGLSVESAKEAASWLEDEHSLEGCTIDLIDLLSGRGFPKDTARKAVKLWGNRAAEIIKRNPYRLFQFRGCGFRRCDALYLDLGLPANKLKRQTLCIWYVLESDTDGHTFFPIDRAVNGLSQFIGGSDVNPKRALMLGKRSQMIRVRRTRGINGPLANDGDCIWVSDSRKAEQEERLAESIVEAMNE